MKEGDEVIVSIKTYATIRDINPDGTFSVSVRKIGKTALESEIVARGLVMSQLEAFV